MSRSDTNSDTLTFRSRADAAWLHANPGLHARADVAPIAPSVDPSSQEVVKAETYPCPGPAGLWSCARDLGHGGNHVRIDAEPTAALILRDVEALRAERDEYRRLLVLALPLLIDVTMNRGAAMRRDVVAQIQAAVAR